MCTMLLTIRISWLVVDTVSLLIEQFPTQELMIISLVWKSSCPYKNIHYLRNRTRQLQQLSINALIIGNKKTMGYGALDMGDE